MFLCSFHKTIITKKFWVLLGQEAFCTVFLDMNFNKYLFFKQRSFFVVSESLDRTLNEYDSESRSIKSSSVESILNKAAMKAENFQLTKTASIKARPSSQRASAADLEQFLRDKDRKSIFVAIS
ncbi:SH3 and multiple ankyrin repeat domains protein 1 [Nephila pilipes]|uniref:SH3 and multiple ankyrin repeat domains protein 1 n=1 Tax=Nephila pilipes TaxID=299642 RepID=A0A8X6NFM1_NEPPI|nr:SH3 and multiple ankyrin repeat domains protein 1 [Nephila pilipes]